MLLMGIITVCCVIFEVLNFCNFAHLVLVAKINFPKVLQYVSTRVICEKIFCESLILVEHKNLVLRR